MAEHPNILRSVRDSLVDRPGIRTHVGMRVFDGRVPAAAQHSNHIVLRRISSVHEYDLGGEIGTVQTVVQIDVYSNVPAIRDDVAEEVRLMLSGSRGYVGNEASKLFVNAATVERDMAIEDRPVDASDEWVFRRSMDFRITHEQAPAPAET